MLRHYRGPCGRRRRADSGPSRAGRQRFERSPPVGAGSDLAHGQQQPLVARRGRHRRNTGREHLPQPGRQSRAVRHGAHRQGALRTEHHALPQHVRIRRRNVRPHRQIGHGVQSADRNAPHDRRRSFRRLFGRRRARLHGGSRIPHGSRGPRRIRREVRARQDPIRRAAGAQHPVLHQGHGASRTLRSSRIRLEGGRGADSPAPESGVFQHLAARLQILVAGVRRTAGHDPGYRKNQIRTLENRLRRLESHQKFGQVPGDGELHARMGRPFPRQTRKPAVQGLLHADPTGHHRTARALRRRFVRRLVDRPCTPPTAFTAQGAPATSGTARASTRFPTAVW